MNSLFQKNSLIRIGFGGGCHWCTEAVYQSLIGVSNVQQGWIASEGHADYFSEAVLLDFDPVIIPLETLIAIHLHTHSCTSKHSMRHKYRSAVYTTSALQAIAASQAIAALQVDFIKPIITTVLPLIDFKLNKKEDLNYYYSNPEKPFCKTYIHPKMSLLMQKFAKNLKTVRQVG